MCNPIVFTCLSCGLRHSYKPQPCADARRASAAPVPAASPRGGGFEGGAPVRLCAAAALREYRVSCDRCKDAWNARQREKRRRAAKRTRAASRSSQGGGRG